VFTNVLVPVIEFSHVSTIVGRSSIGSGLVCLVTLILAIMAGFMHEYRFMPEPMMGYALVASLMASLADAPMDTTGILNPNS